MSTRNSPAEREIPFVAIEPQEMADIIAPVAEVNPIDLEISKLPGRSNSSYRVKCANQSLMVRIITADLNSYVKEFNLLTRYAGVLPVGRPLHFCLSSAASQSYPVTIHSWVDGENLAHLLAERPELTAAAARAVGETLARFREVRFETSSFLSPQLLPVQPFKMNRRGYLDYMNGLLTQSLAGRRLEHQREAIWRFVQREARSMDKLPDHVNLTHGTFRPSNIIVRVDGEQVNVEAILNWENAMAWNSLFDISQLLDAPVPTHAEFEQQLLQAFAAHGGEVPDDWNSIKQLLQLLSGCDLLARPADIPGLTQQAIETISSIVRG